MCVGGCAPLSRSFSDKNKASELSQIRGVSKFTHKCSEVTIAPAFYSSKYICVSEKLYMCESYLVYVWIFLCMCELSCVHMRLLRVLQLHRKIKHKQIQSKRRHKMTKNKKWNKIDVNRTHDEVFRWVKHTGATNYVY